jgi:putative Mg2+ transporter-C (MgtC) family protein
MPADVAILLRLLVALILAGAIGWERETVGKSAGIRTHMFVGMGAALFVALGNLVILDFQHYGSMVQFDPIRLIEAIVAAVGFLGAGTIFVARDKDHVKGLTTAASLWATAAIGIAVGLEHYVLAIGATALVFIVLRLLLLLKDDADYAEPKSYGDSSASSAVGDWTPGRRGIVQRRGGPLRRRARHRVTTSQRR